MMIVERHMAITERHQQIIQQMEIRGVCTYQELAGFLDVSTMTVRRDIDKLAEAGQVIRVLGGAQKAHAALSLYETSVMSRVTEHQLEKRAIAVKAMELIQHGQTLYLDGGTTCMELARLLAEHGKQLTIISNSAMICLETGRGMQNMIVGLGGQLDPSSLSFVGPTSEEWASKFFPDLALLSTKGFLPAEGTFESSLAVLRMKRIMADRACKTMLLVDHSKFDQRALCKVLDISQIDVIIADDGVAEESIEQLRAAGKEVHIAELSLVGKATDDVS